jgi:molybdate transport system substrate-binding protein
MMRALLAALLVLAATPAVRADTIKLLTTGVFKPVAQDIVPAFERQTGHKVTIVNDTAGALRQRVMGGEKFDVLVLTADGLKALVDTNRIADASIRPLVKVGIGVAVPLSAPQPDISSVEGFRRTLLAARAVAYMDPGGGATSGIYLAKLFESMGVAPEIARKAVLVRGGSGLSAERVASGEADIAIQQASELKLVPAVRFAGYLPEQIQQYTIYSGALSADTGVLQAATALLAAFSDPSADAILKRRGLEMP